MEIKTQERRCKDCDCNLLIQYIKSDLETVKTQCKWSDYKCFDCDEIKPTYLVVINSSNTESKSKVVDKLEERCEKRLETIIKMSNATEKRLLDSLDN